ncbi:MAG: polyribonucleotide nucleotidyltransferase, partial [Acidiferrobacterales bacterium]
MPKIRKSLQYGQHAVTLETGEIANQASGAVVASMGETVVLAIVVAAKEARPGQDFFPLTVDYQEKTFAAGRIPGGFFKREGRPSEKEILTCRLIDRPIRPLFADGFTNEVQVVITVLSLDPEIDPDIISMIGASGALALSGVPFNGPIAAARVGYKDGEYILNPAGQQLVDSQLDLVVAGTEKAVLMVESEASELSEETMLGAVMFGHTQMRPIIEGIRELAREAGTQPWDWQPAVADTNLQDSVRTAAQADIAAAYQIPEKTRRQERLGEIHEQVVERLASEEANDEEVTRIKNAVKELEKDVVRGR